MNTQVVNIRTKTPYDVYIGRPGPWGNPFVIGRDGTRSQVIEKHRKWLYGQTRKDPALIHKLAGLRGKRLGCWCHPEPCHGDTLARAAEWAHGQLNE